jgi:predicted PurR-regulated permease PerM
MDKKIIFSIVAIIIVLVLVFLSQQAYSRGIGKTLISDATNQARAVLAQGTNWAMANVYPKISGEVQARGDMIKNEVGQEQKKVSENIGQKISNYFSGVANAIAHPGTPQNCSTQTSSGSND